MMRWLCFCLISLMFSAYSIAFDAGVKIQHDDMLYQYNKSPRLSKVVELINKKPGLYWAGARFYRLDPQYAEPVQQMKKDVVNQLAALEQYYLTESETELASATAKFRVRLENMTFAQLVRIPLDPDIVRAKKSKNPKVDSGSYLISVAERAKAISFTGLVKQQSLPFIDAADISEFVEQIQFEAGASHSFIYMFTPDKSYSLVSTGLWNRIPQSVSPAAYFYVPYEERLLPEEFAGINQNIAQLLEYKVVTR